MRIVPPKRIVVERAVIDGLLVKNLRETLPDARFEVVDRVIDSAQRDPGTVEVVDYRGRFLRPCPGTSHYRCCGYQILNFGTQCTIDCTYCVLKAYFRHANPRLFGNWDSLFSELAEALNSYPEYLFRIGTGEFTDSLLLDPWTRFSYEVVPFFAERENAVLELKTKTDQIYNLERLYHGGHTIVAWSLNPEIICRREEAKAATLDERIEAARRCAQWGYWLAFHFDPMIEHPGWKENYGNVLDRLFTFIDPERIVWVSLGTLRFMPSLKPIIQKRHPRSKIIYGEFIKGLDGKMRYFRDIRVEMYRFMVERLNQIDPGLCVYLCMEGDDIWKHVFGFVPNQREGLATILDNAVKERMGIGRGCLYSASTLPSFCRVP